MSTPLLLSGLPGAMAAETARLAVVADDLTLASVGLTSAARDGETFELVGHSVVLHRRETLGVADLPADAIAVDYSTPDAAPDNVAWLAERGMPMVVGATGFDRQAAAAVVESVGGVAVIAPNMAVPIVLLQAAARYLAETFPNALAGAELAVTESHQQTKRDTSGTAKWMVEQLNALGVVFDVSQIDMIRDPERQRDELAIAEEHLRGHACHQYQLTTAADTVRLGLQHNVMGRRVYAEGTLAAVRFVRDRVDAGVRGVVYSMEDVLRGDAGKSPR